MALSASLLLRQTQSLVMTPQLMQSIQLLQMTHLELSQFIATEVEKNPLLELASSDGPSDFDPDGRGEGHGEDHDHDGDRRPSQTERLSEALDGGFDNVYQDDAGPRKADAPELLSQWKSMPGSLGESGLKRPIRPNHSTRSGNGSVPHPSPPIRIRPRGRDPSQSPSEVRATPLFPLDRRRRLARDVVGDA